MDALVLSVIALLTIAAAATVAPRIGIAAPLVLVGSASARASCRSCRTRGRARVDPHRRAAAAALLGGGARCRRWTSGASSAPITRAVRRAGGRHRAARSACSSSRSIPGSSLAWGIALGAIVSPTDAVATSIVKRLGVSGRVVACSRARACSTTPPRSCCCARRSRGAAASVSFGGALGDFAFAVVAAVVDRVRSSATEPVVRTPRRRPDGQHGDLVHGAVPRRPPRRAARRLGSRRGRRSPASSRSRTPRDALAAPPAVRLARTGARSSSSSRAAVFLVMGLELSAIVEDVRTTTAELGDGDDRRRRSA